MNDMQIRHGMGNSATAGTAHRRIRRTATHGFTLVEVLVSLVIFGIISLALSMALAEALRGETQLQVNQNHDEVVRTVFDVLTRDIQSAYPSFNSSNSIFIAGGGSSNAAATSTSTNSGSNGIQASTAATGSLLAFTSLAHRIQADDLAAALSNPSGSVSTSTPGQANPTPQWDLALIRYDLDPQKGVLRRTVTTVPNPQQLTSTGDAGMQTMVSDQIVSLSFRYWDGIQLEWRTDWDYEQINQTNAPGTTSTTGTTTSTTATTTPATTGSSTTSTTPTTTANGADTYLPSGVEVTLVIKAKDGSQLKYVTLIPITVTQPLTVMTGTAAPTPPPTPTAGTTPSVDVGSGE
jgi:prepilin-type N-terminal cleavage/methylation domain-containing protein